MPHYFFDVKNGYRKVDPAGRHCDDDHHAIETAKLLATQMSLDKPEVDLKRHIAVLNSEGDEISRVAVYSQPAIVAE